MNRVIALAGAACLATLTACSPAEPAHVGVAATAMPTGLDECNHISVEGDPGLGAGVHYDGDARHPFGESARLIICLHSWDPGWQRDDDVRELSADDPAVTVTPVAEIPHDGILEYRITVTGPADGTWLDMEFSGAGFTGPQILTDDDAWWFGPWGDAGS